MTENMFIRLFIIDLNKFFKQQKKLIGGGK